MFLQFIFFVIICQDTLSQQYVINQQFKVTLKKENETNFYMDFTCPKGFIQYQDRCFLNQNISKSCPNLNDLNTTYTLTKHENKSKNQSSSIDLNCSYGIEEFLSINRRDNSIKLNLFFDTSSERKKILLDVFLDQAIINLSSKITCLSRNQTHLLKVNIREKEDVLKENSTTRRFHLELDDNIKIFFCYVYIPGKIKPTGSNIIVGNNDVDETFIARFSKKLLNNSFKSINLSNGDENKYIIGLKKLNSLIKQYKEKLEEELRKKEPNLIDIKSTKFCFKEKSTTTNFTWPRTLIGESVYPKNGLCLDKKGDFIKRTCHGDYFNGGEWSEEIECFNKSIPLNTQKLLNIESIISGKINISTKISNETRIKQDDILNNLIKIIKDEDLKDFDINIILNVLNHLKNYEDFSLEKKFFSIINLITKLVLNENTKKKIIENIENYIEIFTNKKFSSGNFNDFKYFSINPFKQNSINLNNFKIILNQDFLNSLNFPKKKQNNSSITVINFNKNLFPQNNQLKSDVIDVKFKKIEIDFFSKPIILNFPRIDDEPCKCGFYDELTKTWSSSGIKTLINNDFIECESYHLTKFSLLIVSSDIIISRRKTYNEKVLDVISQIELIISAAGTIIILYLTITVREWRKTRVYVSNLSLIIFIECCLLLIVDFHEQLLTGKLCVYFAVTLHFIILKKFILMFLIGLVQVENFMKIFNKLKKITLKISCNDNLLRWIIPFLIAFISVFYYSDEKYYNIENENVKFCYPKKEPHLFFIVIPVSIVLCFNLIVFIVVLIKISKSPSTQAQSKLFRFKLTVLFWFLLGGSWILGVLININLGGIYEDICHYIFAVLAPLQGFILFLFYVVLDKSSNQILKKSFWTTP